MKKCLVFIFCLACSVSSFGQEGTLDSLLEICLNPIDESNLEPLMKELNMASIRAGYKYTLKRFPEFENLEKFSVLHPKIQITIFSRLLYLNIEMLAFEKAKQYGMKSIALAEQIDFYEKVVEMETMIGQIYYRQGDMETALQKFDDAINFIEEKDLSEVIRQNPLAQRALVMCENGFVDECIELYLECHELAGQKGAPSSRLFMSTIILKTLLEVGAYDKIPIYYHLFDEAIKESKFKFPETHYPIQAMFGKDDSPKTLIELKYFVEVLSEMDHVAFPVYYMAISTYFKKLESSCYDMSQIEPYLKDLESRLDEANRLPLECSTYKMLATLMTCKNDYQTAFYYQEKNFHCTSSIKEGIHKDQLLDYQVKYDTELKEKEIIEQQLVITEQNRKRNIYLGLSLLGLVTTFFVWLYFKLRLKQQKDKQKIELLASEKQAKVDAIQAMLNGEENERRRVAKELHDGMGGTLTTVKRTFELSRQLEGKKRVELEDKVLSLIDNAYEETRRISHDMLPAMLDMSGFESSIMEMVAEKRLNGLQVDYESKGDFKLLNDEFGKNIYRITQELFQNVIKHAQADYVLFQIIVNPLYVNYLFEDNGQGFDSNKNYKGIGLQNIANRVSYLKGTLSVDSVKGSGTTITIEIPMTR